MRPRPTRDPAARRRQRGRTLRAGLVTALAVAVYAGWLAPLAGLVTDDTYIHLVFARHFRDGLGLVFNPGDPVYGTTSPLWSLLLGALGRTGVDLLALAQGLSMAFGAAAVLAFALFLRRFLDAWVDGFGFGAERAEVAWALGTLAFATDAWLVRWSASGMESGLATFLVCAGFAAFVRRRPWGRSVAWPAAWWALATLARPEAGLLLVLLLLRILLSRAPWPTRAGRLVRIAVPTVLVLGPWLAYALASYGTLLPQTLAAKTAGGMGILVFAESLGHQARVLAGARGLEMLVLVALLPALVGRAAGSRAEHFVPVAWLVGLPVLYAARGVPVISRYLLLVMPLVVAYAWAALAWAAVSLRARPGWALAGLLVLGGATLALGGATTLRLSVPQARAFSRDVRGTLAGLGRWCHDHTPPGTAVAAPDIGAIGYFADRPIVDLAGLVTPRVTRLLARYGYDDVVKNLRFESVARPAYLVDRADTPERLLVASPYGPCLSVVRVGRVSARGIQHPEPAWYTLYRIDWVEFDRLHGGEREAARRRSPAAG